jgi:hypothetical protein
VADGRKVGRYAAELGVILGRQSGRLIVVGLTTAQRHHWVTGRAVREFDYGGLMKPEELLGQWQNGLRISHRAHYEASKYYERLHLLLSVPTVIMSAVLGTTVFASLQHSDVAWIKLLMAVLSVSMVALTSLQAFFRYSERAERHKTAAVQIGEVRRELEEKLQFSRVDEALVKMIRERWDAADRQSPTIPTQIYLRIEKLVRGAVIQ